jgi:hypothetical protein
MLASFLLDGQQKVGCGFADLCQNNAGDQALDLMTDNVADDIFRRFQAHANQWETLPFLCTMNVYFKANLHVANLQLESRLDVLLSPRQIRSASS